jgi:hypothetical protein
MFDFIRWRQWLADRAEDLRVEGFKTNLRLSDQSPKPGTSLEVTGQRTLALFANWNTGETDYDIADANAKLLSHKWGQILDDLNFEASFAEFANELRNRENNS